MAEEPTYLGEAPGRLDFMGGVADYSGSLVLQVATTATTRVEATLPPAPLDAPRAALLSSAAFGEVSVPLAPLEALVAAATPHGPAPLHQVRAQLDALAVPRWARYVFGSVASFVLETGWLPPAGRTLRLRVSSTVPLAQGVSSSASVEVATLRALGAARGAPLAPLRSAHVAQAAENHVVGAPCGLMDQLASALGSPRRVLPILCRPDLVSPAIPLPRGVVVVGWPSGVEHSVADSPYGIARAATFMAKRALEAKGLTPRLRHITELQPAALAAHAAALPEAITGADFAAQFGAVEDALSAVAPGTTYALRAAARFPVEENFRCVGRTWAWGAAHPPRPPPARKPSHGPPPPHPTSPPTPAAAAPPRSTSSARCRTAPRVSPRWRRGCAWWASACASRTGATRPLAWAARSWTPCCWRWRAWGRTRACTAGA